jgi:hypothetical protein
MLLDFQTSGLSQGKVRGPESASKIAFGDHSMGTDFGEYDI